MLFPIDLSAQEAEGKKKAKNSSLHGLIYGKKIILLLLNTHRITFSLLTSSVKPTYWNWINSDRKKEGEEFKPAWFDLWKEDYIITPEHPSYNLFFTYKLRQTDILELDKFLNDFLENEADTKTDFIRFLKLTLRKHGKKLLQPEQIDTINEWITEQEKEPALSGTIEPKIKGRIKRERDDKVT